jgi:hypothetical protein
MTNLLSLQQIPAGTTIAISHSADFTDQFYVSQPNYPANPLSIVGTLTAGNNIVSGLASVVGLAVGMPVSAPALPPSTRITAVGALSITLNNQANANVSAAQITILPPALDLTGITFSSMLRKSITDTTVLLQMTSAAVGNGAGLMINTGQLGTFGWAVPAAKLPSWPPGLRTSGLLSCVMDIQATDISGAVVNLCTQNGPIPVTINFTVTR